MHSVKSAISLLLKNVPIQRRADGVGIRVGHWNSRTVSLREADRQLCGARARGGIQWRSATTRTYQQTRQLSASLPTGGSGPGHSAQPPTMAQQVLPSGHAAGAKDR